MMGRDMQYGGSLALKVTSITADASGENTKEALSKIEGVKSVAVYPKQHSAAVLFTGRGSLSSQELIDVLGKDGIEASNF